MLGFIYMNLYERRTFSSFHKEWEDTAFRVAKSVSYIAAAEDKKGFLAYLETIKTMIDPKTTDVWIIANEDSEFALSPDYTNSSVGNSFPKDLLVIIEKAFDGKASYNTGFDSVFGYATLRVAVPIKDVGGNVSGAVVVFSQMQTQTEILNASKSMIVKSSLVALVMSIIIAMIFAQQISGPVTKMKKVALKLAEGDYETHIDCKLKGEIEELASALDTLSEKLKENEEMRKNMEQMRSDFFANVSHELRTPITVMRGYTEMLVDDVISNEDKKKQYYQRMLKECTTMQRLVGDLLTLSKMQNPEFEMEMEPIRVSQIFEDIIRSGNVLADKKNITIDLEEDGEDKGAMILGDYVRLRQMFMVIIDNAVKFSHEDGNIHILIKNADNMVVSIRDEGIGISEQELPFIFDKFYKSKLRQNAQGSGLGLVIAKQIALRHNCRIKVESEVEKGTTFYFTFDKYKDMVI